MSWAARRRFIILLIIGAVVVAFFATVGIATFYETPTCTDNKQNQDETGVDCGGSCSYLCTAEQLPPTVLFSRPLTQNDGRTDVIAEVVNKNLFAAAKNVPYTIVLYDSTQAFVQSIQGVLDLPPNSSVPVFVPGIASGKQTAVSAFLTIDKEAVRWFPLTADPRIVPEVTSQILTGASTTPRIEATLANPTVTVLSDVPVVVLVKDEKGDVIAASTTVVPSIPAQGFSQALFAWNGPFPGTPSRIEVIPVIPLP